MKFIKETLKSIPAVQAYLIGRKFVGDPYYEDGKKKNEQELLKSPKRTEIINFLLSQTQGETRYLEIGVRNPDDNYNHIIADHKFSVDPGLEFEENPVDFQMTSDEFFQSLQDNKVLSSDIQFDLIFVDGLHLAEQANKDILNSLKYIKNDGFVVLHDCNPPTEWHARESYGSQNTPAGGSWNGTTWKAFLKWRSNPAVNSCCVDTDWGVGIISKEHLIGSSIDKVNQFYEYTDFMENRELYLNSISFEKLKKLFEK